MSKDEISLVASLCRSSFKDFVEEFWECVPGAGKLIWNWHMDILCEELQKEAMRVFSNQPREYDLVINISPGTSKSSICSVLFQPWTWTFFPQARHICASHTERLVLDLASRARYVLKSDKYKACFPEVELKDDQSSKGDYGNTFGGERFSSTVAGASPVGRHGMFQITDDPIDPQKAGALSGLELEAAGKYVTEVLPTRATNKAVCSHILVMQRLHETDPTGVLFEKSKLEDGPIIRHICLPAELSGTKDMISPVELKDKYVDGLMDPTRMPRKVLKQFRAILGEYSYSGQFLQSPSPPGGGMFKESYFNQRLPASPYQAKRVRYWDVAASSDSGCFTCGVLMSYVDGNFYVENVERGQWGPDERDQHILAVAHRDRDRYGPNYAPKIYIELQPGSAGIDFHKAMVRLLVGFPVYSDKVSVNKEFRAEPFASQSAAGNVRLISDGSWSIQEWIKELCAFPLGRYADQVDSSSAACSILANLRQAGGIRTIAIGKNPLLPKAYKGQMHIAVGTKEELAGETSEEPCLLISLIDKDPVGKEGINRYSFNKLLDSIQVSFCDFDPIDHQLTWEDLIQPYGKPARELTMSREDGKKIWTFLLKKRESQPTLIIIESEGRKGLSLALAICDMLHIFRSKTILKLSDADWKADDKVLPSDNSWNRHIYEMTKTSRGLVI